MKEIDITKMINSTNIIILFIFIMGIVGLLKGNENIALTCAGALGGHLIPKNKGEIE